MLRASGCIVACRRAATHSSSARRLPLLPLAPRPRVASRTNTLRQALPCTYELQARARCSVACGQGLREIARPPATPAVVASFRLATGGAPARYQSTYVSSHYRLDESTITRYLDRKDLVYKENDSHFVVKECPLCSKPTYSKADNMWKLYIMRSGGAYFCHRCGNSGSWFDLKKSLGDINVNISDAAGMAAQTKERRYLRPEAAAVHTMALLDQDKFPRVLEYLTKTRGLSPEVLRMYMVGATDFGFKVKDDQPFQQIPCMVFPWMFAGEAGAVDSARLHRLKIRALDHKSCMSLYPKGGMWGLFGAHTVPADANTVVLTEGEFDAMAVFQATGIPAVSLPNGARSLPVEVLPWLERFEKIYLWMDNDTAGQEGADKFSHKLGIGRCTIVCPRAQPGGKPAPKDANDALLQGWDLTKLLEESAPLPHDQIATFDDLRAEVFREVLDPEPLRGTPYKWLPSMQHVLKGHRRGEMTIVTGSTGSGKTTLLSQLSLDLCRQGVPTLWGSFEIKNVRLLRRMMTQLADRSLYGCTREELDGIADNFAALPMYFLRFFGSTDVNKVLDAMEYAVYVFDVEHIILDNLQFMMGSTSGRGFERFDAQERALEQFRLFASTHNVHLSIVIHPRKEADGQSLSLNSVFGSAKATQEADNVCIVQTSPKGKYLDVKKNRFDGQLGKIPFYYDTDTERFIERARPDMPLPLPPPDVPKARAAMDGLAGAEAGAGAGAAFGSGGAAGGAYAAAVSHSAGRAHLPSTAPAEDLGPEAAGDEAAGEHVVAGDRPGPPVEVVEEDTRVLTTPTPVLRPVTAPNLSLFSALQERVDSSSASSADADGGAEGGAGAGSGAGAGVSGAPASTIGWETVAQPVPSLPRSPVPTAQNGSRGGGDRGTATGRPTSTPRRQPRAQPQSHPLAQPSRGDAFMNSMIPGSDACVVARGRRTTVVGAHASAPADRAWEALVGDVDKELLSMTAAEAAGAPSAAPTDPTADPTEQGAYASLPSVVRRRGSVVPLRTDGIEADLTPPQGVHGSAGVGPGAPAEPVRGRPRADAPPTAASMEPLFEPTTTSTWPEDDIIMG